MNTDCTTEQQHSGEQASQKLLPDQQPPPHPVQAPSPYSTQSATQYTTNCTSQNRPQYATHVSGNTTSLYPHASLYANRVPSAPKPLANPPSEYWAFSILSTLCCCFWIGFMAMIKSNETRVAVQAGDMARAQKASRKALSINIANLVVGIIFWIVLVIYYATVISSQASRLFD